MSSTKSINIDASSDLFQDLRENGSYYVDKTYMLKELLENGVKGKMLFTRPRRFGKTVFMTMIQSFLDIAEEQKELFDGLRIMQEKDLVEKHKNQYPVLFLSFKEAYGNTFSQVQAKIKTQLMKAINPYYDIISSSDKVDNASKEYFDLIYRRKQDCRQNKQEYPDAYFVRLS